jgi:hypothetical protein
MNRYLEQGNAGEKARTGDQFPALGALAGAWAALLRDRFGVANRQEGTRGHPAELSPIFRIPPTASPGSVYRNTLSNRNRPVFPLLLALPTSGTGIQIGDAHGPASNAAQPSMSESTHSRANRSAENHNVSFSRACRASRDRNEKSPDSRGC